MRSNHQVGNKHCKTCTEGFPKECAACGKLVHAELVTEWGRIDLFYHCDGCKLSVSVVSTEDKVYLDVGLVEEK